MTPKNFRSFFAKICSSDRLVVAEAIGLSTVSETAVVTRSFCATSAVSSAYRVENFPSALSDGLSNPYEGNSNAENVT